MSAAESGIDNIEKAIREIRKYSGVAPTTIRLSVHAWHKLRDEITSSTPMIALTQADLLNHKLDRVCGLRVELVDGDSETFVVL